MYISPNTFGLKSLLIQNTPHNLKFLPDYRLTLDPFFNRICFSMEEEVVDAFTANSL